MNAYEAARAAWRANEAWQRRGNPPLVTVGINTYPDGGTIHVLPYVFGVRAPFEGNPAPTTVEGKTNADYGRGAYDAAVRVGAAGLIAGLGLGILGMVLFRR